MAFGFGSLAMATVRIQAEVMLWVIVAQGFFQWMFSASLLVVLPIVERRTESLVQARWTTWLILLLETVATTALLLCVFERRFSPGSITRAWCRSRARPQQIEACWFATKVALLLGIFSVLGLSATLLLETASLDHFFALARFRSDEVGAFRAAVTSMVRDPILEEIFYRGVVFDRFFGKSRDAHGAAVASSILFGGMHLLLHLLIDAQSPWHVYHQAAAAVFIGYVYCMAFCLSGRLAPTVLLHALNNFVAAFRCGRAGCNAGSDEGTSYYSGTAIAAIDPEQYVSAAFSPQHPSGGRRTEEDEHRDAGSAGADAAWVCVQLAAVAVYSLVGVICLERVRYFDLPKNKQDSVVSKHFSRRMKTS